MSSDVQARIAAAKQMLNGTGNPLPPVTNQPPTTPPATTNLSLSAIRDAQELRNKLTTAEGEKARLEAQLQTAQSTINHERQRATTAEQQAQQLVREIGSLKGQLIRAETMGPSDLKRAVSRLEKEAERATSDRDAARRELEQERIKHSQTRTNEALAIEKATKKLQEELKETTGNLENVVHDLEAAACTKSQDDEALREKEGLLQAALNQATQALEDLATAQAEKRQMETELGDANRRIGELERQLQTKEQQRQGSQQAFEAEQKLRQQEKARAEMAEQRLIETGNDFAAILALIMGNHPDLPVHDRIAVFQNTREQPSRQALVAMAIAVMTSAERTFQQNLLNANVPAESLALLSRRLRDHNLAV